VDSIPVATSCCNRFAASYFFDWSKTLYEVSQYYCIAGEKYSSQLGAAMSEEIAVVLRQRALSESCERAVHRRGGATGIMRAAVPVRSVRETRKRGVEVVIALSVPSMIQDGCFSTFAVTFCNV